MPDIPDSSEHLYSFLHPDAAAAYVYGDRRAMYREELELKTAITDAAAVDGRRLGESFQGLRRIIASGTLNEEGAPGGTEVPLRVVVQRFRNAHRPGMAGKLYIHSSADGLPAEYLVAQVENIAPIEWQAPITYAAWEVSFACEPEYWYDALLGATFTVFGGTGFDITYRSTFLYEGPTADFPADAVGLPTITLVVDSIETGRTVEATPATITLQNLITGDLFVLSTTTTGTFILDSYTETTKKTGVSYEWVNHLGYLRLRPSIDQPTLRTQDIRIACDGLTLSAVPTLSYMARHL